jgi:predicted lipid-binding transport protein (Tim44 family)
MLLDIIILAIVTFFIFLKLNKTIGKIDEEQKLSIQQKIQKQKEHLANMLANQAKSCNINNTFNNQNSKEKIVGESNTISTIFPHLTSNSLENLQLIFEKSNIDHHFFLKGAKMTFEIIINSFASGNLEESKNLICPSIFKGFNTMLQKRQQEKHSLITNLISIDEVSIVAASCNGNLANIIVKFSSKQINYIQDENRNIISGSKDQILNITDNWAFQRNLMSESPAWQVISTNS